MKVLLVKYRGEYGATAQAERGYCGGCKGWWIVLFGSAIGEELEPSQPIRTSFGEKWWFRIFFERNFFSLEIRTCMAHRVVSYDMLLPPVSYYHQRHKLRPINIYTKKR